MLKLDYSILLDLNLSITVHNLSSSGTLCSTSVSFHLPKNYLLVTLRLWDFPKEPDDPVYHLKCPYHQNFYFPVWSYISCNEHLRKKFFDLDKKRFCYECLKTWKSYFLTVDPCRWSQRQHAQSCDVDSGTCNFRLDLSHLFYLCKFSFVVHAKCSFPARCMNY